MTTNYPYKIILIGAGQLGSRHLQGLAQLDLFADITVIDPSNEALDVAKNRFYEAGETDGKGKVNFLNSIDEMVEADVDLAIIATTADHRAAVTRSLLAKVEVRHILFEKVLFQSIHEIEDISDLLQSRMVNAWVNCPRRMYPFYLELKGLFSQDEVIAFYLQGGEWGLACNAIHFLDLIAFFVDQSECTMDVSWLDPGFIASKRKNFVELTGSLRGRFPNGSEFVFHSRKECDSPHRIFIQSSNYQVFIDETQKQAWLAKKENNWHWECLSFQIPLQSELTHLAAAEILKEKRSRLTSFKESSKLHKTFLEALVKHFNKYSGEVFTSCPVT